MNMIDIVVNALDKCDTEYDGPDSEIYEAFAKAAITAMREPTFEMLKVCNPIIGLQHYQAMIDAALTEEKK